MSFYELDESSKTIKQPAGLKIKLKPHQLTSIAAMRELESNSSIVIDQPQVGSGIYNAVRFKIQDLAELTGSTYSIETNSAILADKVGSGKTYMIVGLILEKGIPQSHERIMQSTDHYTIKMISNKEAQRTNLIVVPHNLVNQWGDFISKSKLTYLKLNSESDFDMFFDIDYVDKQDFNYAADKFVIHRKTRLREIPGKKVKKTSGSKTEKKNLNTSVFKRLTLNKEKINKMLSETDVIVLNIKRYQYFVQLFRNTRWARVIIDEMDSVMIPATFNEYGNFNWFLTATPTAIFYNSGRRYVNKIFGYTPQLLNYFTVKNKNEYVDKSMVLPAPHVFMIETMLQRVYAAVKDLVPPEVMQMINAGNIKEAVNKLNCDVDTSDNIVSVLTNQLKKELHNLEAELKYNNDLIPADQDAHDKKIKKLKSDIDSCKDRLKLVHDRIKSIKEEDCFICASSFEMPTIMTCCKSVFCFKCLVESLKIADNKCPYCRKVVGKKDYKVIVEKEKSDKKKKTKEEIKSTTTPYSKLDKPDVLYDILNYISKHDDKPRILIFSDYSQTFVKIQQHITKAGLQYQHISGTPSHISNVIEEFNKGVTNVLMLDSQHYGSGLNLQSANYLILYHRMKPELETQVIGRAQRYGRTGRLRVIYLVNGQESKDTILTRNPLNILSKDELWNITDPVKVDEDVYEENIDDINDLSDTDKSKKKSTKKIDDQNDINDLSDTDNPKKKSIKKITATKILAKKNKKEKTIKKEKVKPGRKSPKSSATAHKAGTKMRGIDGNMWIVTSANGIHRWIKHNIDDLDSETNSDLTDFEDDLEDF